MLGKTWTYMLAGLLFTCCASPLWADTDGTVEDSTDYSQAEVEVGYRSVSRDDNANRAREYDSLQSSPNLDLNFRGWQKTHSLAFEGRYLNDKDYSAEVDLNLHSQVRLLLRNERMYHNLDHIPYDPRFSSDARQNSFYLTVPRHDYSDENPLADYGLQVDRTDVKVRAKLPDFPAHLSLSYWRWEKEGDQQLRFVKENCAGACHMTSKTRKVKRVTEEFTGSIDSHLGMLDLIFEQVVRVFRDQQQTPLDNFQNHTLRPAGFYEHDATPDSRFTQSTIKAHTALGGGFVANASFSIGERTNESKLRDVAPVDAETDFRKLASDVTYTPSANWTVNFRYRMLDLDQDNASQLAVPTPKTYKVRDSIDIDRNFYEASVAYRPTPRLTLKGDYRREDIHRSNTDGPDSFSGFANNIDPYWELPEDETLQKYRLSLSSRHLAKNALRLQAWYQYQTSDDPAYNTSIEEGHTGFVSATYRPGTLWGTTASLKVDENRNNNHKHSQFIGATPVYYDMDRERSQQNASLGFWLNPLEAVNIDLNYGYLRTRITQDLLFGAEPPIYTVPDDNVEFRQSVQTISLGTNWQATKALACRVEGYHIRSEANYSPNFPANTALNYDPSALRSISKVDIRQNGLRGRINWQFDQHWTAGFEATYDNYDDRDSSVFDGSVQTYMASLSRSW